MKKYVYRILALVVAILIMAGTFMSIIPTILNGAIPNPFELTAYAATPAAATGGTSDSPMDVAVWADAKLSDNVTRGKVDTSVSVSFRFTHPDFKKSDLYEADSIKLVSGPFGTTTDTRLRTTAHSSGEYLSASLSRLIYTGGSGSTLVFELDDMYRFSVVIPEGYFKAAEAQSTTAPKPQIMVQAATVKNAQGEVLAEVNKDTPAFTVEITYYDFGLGDEGESTLKEAKNFVFMKPSPGLTALRGMTGKIEQVTSSLPYPRYRVTFENIKSDGSAKALNFFVQYDIEDYDSAIQGDGVAELSQVKAEDSAESLTLKPNVIISQYSYGDKPIVAGDVFNLDFRFENTSGTVAVENLVVTIEPASGFVIAAASNTVFFPKMAPGENKPFSVGLKAGEAITNASTGEQVTEYSVLVKFAYQYFDNKVIKDGNSEVKIAIPVTQLDRFAVDEITDYSQYLPVGEEGYVSVPITNKGKALIGNISGFVESKTEGAEFISPIVRYGSLEGGGKSATVELSITVNTPGEFMGDAVIEYEDGNMNQKRVSVPFTIMVEEPYRPDPSMNPGMAQDPNAPPEDSGPSAFTIVMSVLGALLIAGPLAMYLMKRTKLRGSEEFDEAF